MDNCNNNYTNKKIRTVRCYCEYYKLDYRRYSVICFEIKITFINNKKI